MTDLLKELRERGFIQQTSDDESADKPLEKLLAAKRVTAYAGFDPPAASLHVGNLVVIMGLKHIERAGHRPIALVGGGTGLIGDPSGKTEMRRVLDEEAIRSNIAALRAQLSRYIDLAPTSDPKDPRGLLLDNAEWLRGINYIQFLRDIGRHFSLNRMLAAESVKLRLESATGLSFLEFNYSILQAYDYLVL
ncbi:MAG TPA: tyrosine--tRNA ligase, partial [Planctomycetota bacterium]|nr:tyrosine--tRNA ligase [Planctomycetota bacterium]